MNVKLTKDIAVLATKVIIMAGATYVNEKLFTHEVNCLTRKIIKVIPKKR